MPPTDFQQYCKKTDPDAGRWPKLPRRRNATARKTRYGSPAAGSNTST